MFIQNWLIKIHAYFPATQKADKNEQPDVPIDKQSMIPSVTGKYSAGCNNEKKRKHSYSFFFPQCRTIN